MSDAGACGWFTGMRETEREEGGGNERRGNGKTMSDMRGAEQSPSRAVRSRCKLQLPTPQTHLRLGPSDETPTSLIGSRARASALGYAKEKKIGTLAQN